MRRWLFGVGGGATLLVAVAFVTLPAHLDDANNPVDTRRALPRVGLEALALHRRLTVVDFHADTLLWKRDLLAARTHGHVTLPMLEQGNIALQIFPSVTQSPPGQNIERNEDNGDRLTALFVLQAAPPRTWTSRLARSLYHADQLRNAVARSNGRLRLVTTSEDLDRLLTDRAGGKRVTGAMLAIEGLQNLEGRLDSLDALDRAGYRLLGLTHFVDNAVAGSAHGVSRGGLTPLGREVVKQAARRGMVIDIAHASPRATDEVLAMTSRPVISSHGGVQAVCPGQRNLSDDQIRRIARTGGVIGIGYWREAMCSAELRPGVIASILHVRKLVGINHVALGSDWDGSVAALILPEELAAITQGLLDAGLSEGEIAKVMGGNAIRVLRATLPSLRAATAEHRARR